MPVPRTWLPRVYEIIEILKTSKAEAYDRTAIEKLFELQRRAALDLMKQAGAVRSQVHSVVPRQVLLAWVEKIEATEAQGMVRRRKLGQQIDQDMEERRAARGALEEAGKPRVEFPLTREILEATITSLPPEIRIQPGRITVNFNPDEPTEACQLLYMLGLALANDFESFTFLMHANVHARKQAC